MSVHCDVSGANVSVEVSPYHYGKYCGALPSGKVQVKCTVLLECHPGAKWDVLQTLSALLLLAKQPSLGCV